MFTRIDPMPFYFFGVFIAVLFLGYVAIFGQRREKKPTAQKPRYPTAYSGMTFLGRHHDYDLYWLPCDVEGANLHAQFGEGSGQYMSGLCFGWIPDKPYHPMVEARRRAEARGLYAGRDKYERMTRSSSGLLYVPQARDVKLTDPDKQPATSRN